jgi:hypothetical protein
MIWLLGPLSSCFVIKNIVFSVAENHYLIVSELSDDFTAGKHCLIVWLSQYACLIVWSFDGHYPSDKMSKQNQI